MNKRSQRIGKRLQMTVLKIEKALEGMDDRSSWPGASRIYNPKLEAERR